MKLLLILSLILSFTGCEMERPNYVNLHVIIPQHPWEEGTDLRLWYSIKWNDNGKIETLFVDNQTREVDIKIPRNTTVYICAYPLGEMLPFGTAITPDKRKTEVTLTQNEGYLAHLLINSDLEATEHVNFNKLTEKIYQKTEDFRDLEDTTLVADVINGRLDSSSIEIKDKIGVSQISIPNGKWVSECSLDGYMFVTEGRTKELELPCGIFRYYCEELDREFRLVIDSNGSIFHSLRYGMTGL